MLLPEPRLPALRSGPSLRWAVLAPGRIAEAFVGALHAHTHQRVVAVGSRSRERAGAFAARHGIGRAHDDYRAAVDDPEVDIVYVAAPHSRHRALAELAIAAGKHVLIEKPIAPTAADAAAIRDAARTAGVFAMEAMWTRFHPWVDVADRLIADGAIGEVRHVAAEVGRRFPFDPADRLFDPALAGGALLDVGVYAVWAAIHFGGAPDVVAAHGALTSTGVDEQSTVVLRTGAVHVAVGASLATFTPSEASIGGTEGRLRVAGRFPAPAPLELRDRDDAVLARLEDRTGLAGHAALARQAAWAAIHVDDGLLEAPQHPLDSAVQQAATIERALAAIHAAARTPDAR